ncbi:MULTISPECIES: DUF6435 family protein [Agarivorans]|uniref:Integrase n=1 Tax=Agarivorans gilvus TaxID=680279 RepID=A0ABQ1I4Y2_9ALTE|nr:DUF6435 family protein [Agarivorans gilvus]GGB17185.1 hypothetical protein GCM10007414_33270 [Agarivorans gilvus]
MLSLLKPISLKRKRNKYYALVATASKAQQRGDIMTYSMLSADAVDLWKEIEQLELS